jgi:hypothetical protein
MTDEVRFILLFEPYNTPRFKYGAVVTCAIGGVVKVIGLAAAPISWPKYRRASHLGAIILYGALADAVRRESAQAASNARLISIASENLFRE